MASRNFRLHACDSRFALGWHCWRKCVQVEKLPTDWPGASREPEKAGSRAGQG